MVLDTEKLVLNGEHHAIDPFARVCAIFGRKNEASEQSREPLDSHTKNVQSKLRIHFYLAKFMRQSNLSRKSPFEQNTANVAKCAHFLGICLKCLSSNVMAKV